MVGISIYVFDLMIGKLIGGVLIEFYDLSVMLLCLLKWMVSNVDGCIDVLMLSSEVVWVGQFELCFLIGMYFNDVSVLFDVVLICFIVFDLVQYYYVLLFCLLWLFLMYCGS